MKSFSVTKQKGFTLVELMITIGIVGILAAIAIPSYQNYTRRAYYSEVVQATAPYRLAVSECAQSLGTKTGCSGGAHGIPNDITAQTGAVASLEVEDGVITVTPVQQNGILTGDDYVLTPTLESNGTVTWASSGEAKNKGYAK